MSINDVAKLAGVSSSTVSRVINNHPRVAPETAKSVRKAMQELGYAPSDRRPGPKPSFRPRSGSATIAFLVFGTSRTRATPAFEDLLRGVSIGASKNDLNLVFNHVPDAEYLPPRILDQRTDGILLHGLPPVGEARERLRRLPTVWLMGGRRRPEWGDQVLPDWYEIGELAAKYLTGRGHTHLAFMNLDSGHWSLRAYGQAFMIASHDANASAVALQRMRPPSPEYWHQLSREAVDSIVSEFRSLPNQPTGIFVADDMQVAMLQPALQQAGVEIGPGKVEIISCNNEEPYLVGLMPRPAVIDIRVESIGRRGVEQLLWRFEHPDVNERLITAIEPHIVNSNP